MKDSTRKVSSAVNRFENAIVDRYLNYIVEKSKDYEEKMKSIIKTMK